MREMVGTTAGVGRRGSGDDAGRGRQGAVTDASLLGALALFHDLKPDELDTLNALLHRRTFPAGTAVMTAEQPGDVAYIIMDGAVKIHVEQEDGTDVILAILGKGEVVGEMSMVDSLGRSANVVTLEPSPLLWMDRAAFWDCLRAMPTMTYNLAEILSRRLRLANERIQALATLDVYGRVARQILAFAREYGEVDAGGETRIPVRLTQGDLANLVGASRVRVNQVLVSYKRRRSISIDRNHRITVHNQAALARYC